MHGEYKMPGGKLVVADIESDGEDLTSVVIGGDFFAEPDEALFRMQNAVLGRPADLSAADLTKLMEEALEPTDTLLGVSPHAIGVAIRRALGSAIGWEDIDFEVIHGPSVSPMINVALDEVLPAQAAAGKHKAQLRIWEWNSPQVVIGSFQSYDNEINPEGIAEHGITVSRRVTGGGAMFMEPGNCITYSLVVPTALVDGLSFEESYRFLDEWVIEALAKVGVKAKVVPLNDIASERGKIGGAAQKRFANGYMLHHVTMAYDIDAAKMNDCLRIGKEKIRDKGLRSAVKRVDPMRSQTGMEREAIIDVLLNHFAQKYDAVPGEITAADLALAERLNETKFSTPEWVHRVP